MNYNRSTPNSGRLPSPPVANWRNHPPGADDGAGDGPAGENAFMPTSMPLPPQMMSTLQARLEQAAMAGDGPHSTLAERARYAAMFQNMEHQLQHLRQQRNQQQQQQQQQQVQSPLPPPATPGPMTQSVPFRRTSGISQNQRNQRLQQRQQQQLRASAAMEFLREREQRQQQRDQNEPQQIPSASTLFRDAMLSELENHRREIERYEFAFQHQIELQHLERIVHSLSQCQQRFLQFARDNNISIPGQNPLTIFSNLNNEQTAHMVQPSTHSGAGIQQVTQPPLQHRRTVQSALLSSPSMLPSQSSRSPLPSQVHNSNFWEDGHQYLNRLHDIIVATQDALSSNASGRANDPNILPNSSSTQLPAGNQLNAGSVTNNSIVQSLIRTFQTLQAVTENANRLAPFFYSVVLNANRQNTEGNLPVAVSFDTNQASNMPGVHSPVPNLANSRLFSQEPSNQQFYINQNFNHNSDSDSSNTTNESSGNNESISTATTSSESQQQSVNTNQQSIDPRSFLIPNAYLYNQNNTNNIYINNNYTLENCLSYGYYTMLGYIANRDNIEGSDCTSHSSSPTNNRSNNLTGPMPEESGYSTTSSNASDDSEFASFRKYTLQEWQHFAKIAHENLSTANRVLESLFQRPEYAESYRQYQSTSFFITKTSNNVNANSAAPMTIGSASNPTASTLAGSPSNLSAASGVSSENDRQTTNELNTLVENITNKPVGTIPSISTSQYSLPSSSTESVVTVIRDSEASRVFGNDDSVTSIPEVQTETNVEEYILLEQNDIENNNNLPINDIERFYALDNRNYMNDVSITDSRYLEIINNENSYSLTANDMEAHSVGNNCNYAHFSEVNNGATYVEGNQLDNDALGNNNFLGSTDSHYLVFNDSENRVFEFNLMGNNVLHNNNVLGNNTVGCPSYEYNNSESHDWAFNYLENNYLESDEVNSNHTCTSTYLENNGLQVNGPETLLLEDHDLDYNNFESNNIVQENNFMENNEQPFVEFNDFENHNSNWNNFDFLEDYEDLV